MRRLIFIHGRSQQGKKAAELKSDWIQALREGLVVADCSLDIPDERISFPYFGDTLYKLADGSPGDVPAVTVKGYGEPGAEECEFIASVVREVLKESQVSEDQVWSFAEPSTPTRKGAQNWPWVVAALRVIDKSGLSGITLEYVTRDVYRYLSSPGVQTEIEEGVRQAFLAGEDCVVVAHSLGSVIAYNMIRRYADVQHVSTLITLGSPLGIRAIRDGLRPLKWPPGVGQWFNAFDPRDVVSLHPLNSVHFPTSPPVENFNGVRNKTRNRHGISGYLGDGVVALRIRDALLQ